MYGLTEADARPGTSLFDLMKQSIERGVHRDGTTAEQMYSDFKERLIDNKEPVLHRILSDARVIAVATSRWRAAAGSAPTRTSPNGIRPKRTSRTSRGTMR